MLLNRSALFKYRGKEFNYGTSKLIEHVKKWVNIRNLDAHVELNEIMIKMGQRTLVCIYYICILFMLKQNGLLCKHSLDFLS